MISYNSINSSITVNRLGINRARRLLKYWVMFTVLIAVIPLYQQYKYKWWCKHWCVKRTFKSNNILNECIKFLMYTLMWTASILYKCYKYNLQCLVNPTKHEWDCYLNFWWMASSQWIHQWVFAVGTWWKLATSWYPLYALSYMHYINMSLTRCQRDEVFFNKFTYTVMEDIAFPSLWKLQTARFGEFCNLKIYEA